jgi:hypothetical protein
MKKLSTLIPALGFCLISIGQSLTNGSFENWTNAIPNGWSTSRSALPASTAEVKETVSFFDGAASINMTSTQLGAPIGLPYSGFVHYGASYYDASIGDIRMSLVQYAYRPDSIRFAYKYIPSAGDSAGLSLSLTKGSGGSLIANITMGFHATPNFKVVTLPIKYMSTLTPDSLSLTFQSSFDLFNPTIGSKLWIDGVKMIYKSTTPNGIEQSGLLTDVKAYPNPTASKLHLILPEGHTATEWLMYDLLGNQISHQSVNDTHLIADVASLDAGLYLYRLLDCSGHTVYTGKFNKQ